MSTWRRVLGFDDRPSKRSNQKTEQNPWQSAAAVHSGATAAEGFSSARPRRIGAPRTWLWLRNAAAILLILAGLNQLVLKPVRGWFAPAKAPSAVAQQVDAAAAAAIAASFSVDYLSYAAASVAARETALRSWIDPKLANVSAQVGAWSGSSVVLANTPTTGEVVPVGSGSAVVAVTVRLQPFAAPSGGSSQSAPGIAAPPQLGAAAYVPAIPAGYTVVTPFWVRLLVPITTRDNHLVVSGSPVFSGDSADPIILPKGDLDTDATDALSSKAKKIFGAYAASDLSYITAPGATLRGLAGVVGSDDISDAAVMVSTRDGQRWGSVSVQWTLIGTDLRITQKYGIALKSITSAPLVTAIGLLDPTMERN